MELTEVFILVLLIAAVSTQKKNLPPLDSLPPPNKGTSNDGNSGGLMSKLFTWAQSVRPVQPPNQNIPGSNVKFPPDSLGSDAGFPPDSLGPDAGFLPDSLGPEDGLPADSLGPGTGSSNSNSLLSGGVLSLPPSDTMQPPKQNTPIKKLPLNQKLPGPASSDIGSLLSGGMLSLPPDAGLPSDSLVPGTGPSDLDSLWSRSMLSLPPSDTMQPPKQNTPVKKLPLNQKLPRPASSDKGSLLSGGMLSLPPDAGLPPDSLGPGTGPSDLNSLWSGGVLSLPPGDPSQPPKQSISAEKFPPIGKQNSGIPVQNTDVKLKPDIRDPNVLFPAAEVLPSLKDTQNNDFLMNFFPTFPTGEEIVNLNNGGFVQELGQSGFLPAKDVLSSGSTGMLPGKPDRLPVENFKPQQTFPSDKPIKPDIHKPTVNKQNKPNIHMPSVDKTNALSGLEPIPLDQFQPADLGKFPINQFTPAESGMVPVDQFTPIGSEKALKGPFKDPHDKFLPVGENRFPRGPFAGGDHSGRVPVDQFTPMGSGRPISMVPLDEMKQKPIPDLHPMKEPALDIMRPGGIVALGKPKSRSSQSIDKPIRGSQSINKPMANGAQDVLPKTKPEVGRSRADEIMAKWIALYPEGRRPEKLKPVQIGEVHEIAPPSPDQALLSQISLVNYGKDKAMRRRLREERKQARKRQRRLRKQRRQQRLQQNNGGNQRPPQQGRRNNRNIRNNRNRRQRNTGDVMGMSRGT